MVVNFSSLVGSITNHLNDNISDPLGTSRVGSFFYTGDQEIFFTKYMPKGQVTEDTMEMDNVSFGKPYDMDVTYRADIHFFTKKGDTVNGLKDRALIMNYLETIRDSLLINQGVIGAGILTFDTVERPVYLEDQRVFVGTLSAIYRVRDC